MEKKTLSALVALLLTFGAVITDGSLLTLRKMIKQVTKKKPILNFSMYGCYCGLGGDGEPVDDIDWCCYYHDCCYTEMMKKGCKPRTEGYSYTYQSRDVNCGGVTQCQQQICRCDRHFVLCLKKNLGSYRKSYRFHLNFLCRGSAPMCQAKWDHP